ncbi:hypothetical protein [endosymbiont of Pachyrhynchus infernalis]|uniref:hypothetical protein n=1 Tax=endosymbiont of Pachyrhynchus infernalis TaxID=1971488 RepID=UPI000DC730A2|nr:hypothetical protein [endosymbiont of Pachyrhynchus infernalis]BBA84812.1 50S ribosomal protein L25 [endosymbiont of Pachyrhynchus infernalis]
MLILCAEIRNICKNKRLNKKLRVSNKILAVIYGKNILPINIIIEYKDINFLKEKDNLNKEICIKINELCFLSKIKDIQINLIKNKILHIDFYLLNKY